VNDVPRTELLRDLDRPTGRVLLVDGVEQSYVDIEDPTHLEFEYMQHMAIVLDTATPAPQPVRAVHLGAGAMSMPRWIAATRPGSEQVALELSTEVLSTVSGLADVPGCTVLAGDAVERARDLSPAAWDVVIWDLYDGPRAVTTALTHEVLTLLRALLAAPSGLLVLNVSDVVPFEVVRPVLASLVRLCDDIAVLAEPRTLRGRRSGNCVLVGTAGVPLPVSELAAGGAAAPVRARVVHGDALMQLIGNAAPGTASAPLPLPDPTLGRGFL
jgi:hypothetical protein